MRDHDHRVRVRFVHSEDASAFRLALHDGHSGAVEDPLEHLALVCARLQQRGVKHGHERDVETVDEVENLRAVGAAEQSVLMLKQHRIEVVQHRERTAQ